MKTLLLILSIFLLTSCNSDYDTTAFEPVEIEFTTIGREVLSGNGDEGIVQSNMVITNSADWQNLLAQMNSDNDNETINFTETDIDFDNFTVIAIFLEVRFETWFVEITSIIENENNIVVSKEEDGGGFQGITQPYHIVKIPITNKPIVFE